MTATEEKEHDIMMRVQPDECVMTVTVTATQAAGTGSNKIPR